jgi:hypothetical protein
MIKKEFGKGVLLATFAHKLKIGPHFFYIYLCCMAKLIIWSVFATAFEGTDIPESPK